MTPSSPDLGSPSSVMILSEPSSTLRVMQVNPWQRLAEDWPGITVKYEDLGARWGVTKWRRDKPIGIALHSRLTQVQRRVTIAHECEHLDRGAPCETIKASVERRVLAATAKYLLPDLELVAGMLAVYDMHRAADELWVTFPVLVDRLRSLSDLELTIVGAPGEHAAA